MARRKGRGMLSSIDLLPNECEEDIVWAKRELDGHAMTQTDILLEFNRRIGAKGHGPISKGSFSRHSVRLAEARRELLLERQMIDIAGEILPNSNTDAAVIAREILKLRAASAAVESNVDTGKVNSLLDSATKADKLVVSKGEEARKNRKSDQDQAAHEAKQSNEATQLADAATPAAADAAERVATEAGLSAERVTAIRKGVLGLAG